MSNTEIAKQVNDAIGGVGERQQCCSLCDSSSRDGKDESKINKDVAENIEKVGCFL